ncbi:MAG: redoxin domain-containing protein [Bacteroidota bacterium]
MKKTISTYFSLCLLFLAFIKAASAVNYNFQFQIKGLDIPEKCVLGYYAGDFTYAVDSAKVANNGRIQFRGQRDLLDGMYFLMIPQKGFIDFIVYKDYQFQVQSDITNLQKNLTVSGSTENEGYFTYQRFLATKKEEIAQQNQMLQMLKRATKDPQVIQESQQRINELRQSIADRAHELMETHTTSFFCMMMEANELPEVPSNIPVQLNGATNPIYLQYVKDKFWDNFDFNENGLLQTKIFATKASFFFEQLTARSVEGFIESTDILAKKSMVNPIALQNTLRWLVTTFENTKSKGTDAVFVHIFDTYFTTPEENGIDVATFSRIEQKANYFRPTLVGNVAPNITLLDQNDRSQSLHDLKAKYTMLYFFSPLCDKCRTATPKVVELFQQYKSKGLKCFAVCTDDKKAYWKNYVQENKLPWTCVMDTDADLTIESKYAPNSLPNIFILDQDKKILANRVEVEELEAALAALVK